MSPMHATLKVGVHVILLINKGDALLHPCSLKFVPKLCTGTILQIYTVLLIQLKQGFQ